MALADGFGRFDERGPRERGVNVLFSNSELQMPRLVGRKSNGENVMNPRMLTLCAVLTLGSGPPLAFAQATQDATDPKTFAAVAASSNMFEIESSQLALDQSKTENVQAFAE